MIVFLASKLVDEIELGETLSLSNNKSSYFSKSKFKNDSDADTNYTSTSMNKIIEDVEELCKACIESKYTRILKSKKITSIIKHFQEIHADLWGPYKPSSISGKN